MNTEKISKSLSEIFSVIVLKNEQSDKKKQIHLFVQLKIERSQMIMFISDL